MMDRRPLGKTGIEVGEIGLSVAWNDDAPGLLRRAHELGCTLFDVGEEGREWVRANLPDACLLIRSDRKHPVLISPAGEEIPAESGAFIAVPYNLVSQEVSIEVMPAAEKSGAGILAVEVVPAGPDAEKYSFLKKEGRTFVQAAVQFVLANEHVSCAVVKVEDPASLDEVFSAPDAAPFSLPELENIFETWSGRCDG
jgi:aryl-alcohol dehydrogenase-like predicted oxidoreductase